MGEIKWTPTALAVFEQETQTLAQMDGMMNDYVHIALAMARAPFRKTVQAEYATDRAVAQQEVR